MLRYTAVVDIKVKRTIRVSAQVTADHMVHVRLPEDVKAGPAEVIVQLGEVVEPSRQGSGSDRRTLGSFLEAPRLEARLRRSKDEIDQAVLAERESWDAR